MDKRIISNVLSADQVAMLYKTYPDVWFLFEVLEKDETGKAVQLKVVSFNENKEVLRNLLLEIDEWEHDYMYTFTYSDGKCDLTY